MLKVINVISDSNIGGAGRLLLTFLRGCDRTKIDMTVLLPENAALAGEVEKLGVRLLTDAGLAEKSFSAAAALRLRKLFRDEKPDVVHAHASMSARVAAKTAGCKTVYTRHSVFPNSALKTKFPLKQLIGAANNYFADAVIAVSPAAADIIVEAGQNPAKVKVIFNGVDPVPKPSAEEKAKIRAAHGVKENDFACGIFARLTPVKGHEYVVEAAKLLSGESGIKFVIAGTGEAEDDIKRRATGLENIIFTGFVENVEKLISAMDLQLNASYGTEATSLALLEGMSAGVPAVVSSFGGNPYVITDGENGVIVPQKDGAAIADAILALYRDASLYARLSENAVEIFGRKFTAAEMVRNIENLYFSL